MATFRTWRTLLIFRFLLCFVAACLAWLQASPAYASNAALLRENARQEAWMLAHKPRIQLPTVLQHQNPGVTSQKRAAARKPVADVRLLTTSEMGRARGRGIYRNSYFAGSPMPWQRSFRDVNLCDGNLFKSFTDLQVAPGRGAGLVLQRTYNSNESRVGPFGIGWTHAYDIRIQESAAVTAEGADVNTKAVNANADTNVNDVPRTDFFGHKHSYHRDADGLYSPPPYLYDETSSDYGKFLVNGPPQVMDDTEKGMDGTIKHYKNVVTNADGTSGNERACDYIQDRHGNTTNLTYGQSYVQPDGSTRSLLTQVTDPTGRSLTFLWNNFGTTAQPAWRIVEVDGPTDPTTSHYVYRVTYAYYTSATDPNAGGMAFNLKSVTLDPDGLSRTTTYTYTTCGLSDGSGPPELALLNSVTDPLGHTVFYQYSYDDPRFTSGSGNYMWTKTIWVSQVKEPGGTGPHTWLIFSGTNVFLFGGFDVGSNVPATEVTDPILGDQFNNGYPIGVTIDSSLRATLIIGGDILEAGYSYNYDNNNNVTETDTELDGGDSDKIASYGPHGNVLTQNVTYFGQSNGSYGTITYPKGTVTTYYNASKYFQKASTTDARGLTTAMDYYSNQDPSPGNRGEVALVQDAGYADPNSPSYQKQFTYTYNQYGQKLTETNLKGVVTQYTYGTSGTDTGNLVQVVQDPGTGHLNRTTTMHYDIMGRVLQSTDPASLTSTFTYNTLGQPLTVVTPNTSSAAGETISYAYGGNGRTLSVTDGRGPTTMAYQSGTDLVQSVTDPVTGTISYTYGTWGERRTMTLPGGGRWIYIYSEDGNQYGLGTQNLPDDQNLDKSHLTLVGITDDQGRQISFGETHTGAPVSVKYNQTYDQYGTLLQYCSTDYDYDRENSQVFPHSAAEVPSSPPVGQLDTLRNTYVVVDFTGHHGYTRILNQNAYTYDDDLNRTTNTQSTQAMGANGLPVTDSNYQPVLTSRQETYTYDKLNRLSTVDYGDGETQSYGFDPMGNRLTKSDTAGTTTSTSYTYDAANRLTSTALNGGSAVAVTSDADGNTLTDTSGRTNTWDSQNRLISCTQNGTTSTYTYGADGLRRSNTVNNVTTYYVYDGTTMIREMKKNVNTGALFNTATYLQGMRGTECRIDETQQTEGYYDPVYSYPNQMHARGVTHWYVYDGLGSVVGEVDVNGNLTSSPKYDVYGLTRSNPGSASSRQGFVGGLGHVSDTETGLIYMRARYYDPSIGRFESQDPGLSGDNWFLYCDDNPVDRVDSTGKSFEWINSVISGPDWFIKGITQAAQEGQESLAEYMEENFKLSMNITRGLGAGVGGSLQLRLMLRSAVLDSLIDDEEEIGVGSYESVGEIGTLIGEAAEGELADMATGEVLATFTSLL